MENTKYGKRREGRWTPIRAKAQDTRANPNSWETHLVRKRWDIGLLRALSPRIMMMMMNSDTYSHTGPIMMLMEISRQGLDSVNADYVARLHWLTMYMYNSSI